MAGKHMESRKRIKLSTVLVIAAALALVTAIGGTMAWLTTHSEGLTNTFTPATISGNILEGENGYTFDGNTKESVRIENTSDVPVYVRVALVPTWVMEENNKFVPVAEPVGNDDVIIDTKEWKSFVPAADSNWVKGNDGYYYYKKPLAAADKTDDTDLTENLFNTAEAKENDPYHMNLQVLLQMIQAEGVNAEGKRPVELAWGVTVNADGTISN